MKRTRAERYRLMLAHRAAAKALEASLKDEAAQEYEREKVRVTWDLPGGGQISSALRHDAVIISNPDAFMEWMSVTYPHQVRRVSILEAVNASWVSGTFLASLLPNELEEDEADRKTVVDPTGGAVVPGVHWVRGGGLASVSIRGTDKTAEKRMNLAAAAYAAGEIGEMLGLGS